MVDVVTVPYSVVSSQPQMMCWIAPPTGCGVEIGLGVGPGVAGGLAVGPGVESPGPALDPALAPSLAPTRNPDGVEAGSAGSEAKGVEPGGYEAVDTGPPTGRGSTKNTARIATTTDKEPMSPQRALRQTLLHDRRSRWLIGYSLKLSRGPSGPDGVTVRE